MAKTAARTAPAPFDKPFADVILRTSDNVEFYVHKIILSLASSFFNTMFSIPQPTRSAPLEQRPVVEVSEDSHALECLLLYCYPVPGPYILHDDFILLDRVLGAAKKYDFTEAIETVTGELLASSPRHPLAIFAIGCHHDEEQIATIAAKDWTQLCSAASLLYGVPMQPTQEELTRKWRASWLSPNFVETLVHRSYTFYMKERITAGPFWRLLQYLKSGQVSSFSSPSSPASSALSHPEFVQDDAVALAATQYPFSRSDADVIVRSSDGHELRVHRTALEMLLNPTAPSALESVFGKPYTRTGSGVPSIFELKDRGHTLVDLLRQCYPIHEALPISAWNVDTLGSEQGLRVYDAAQRYRFLPVLRHYRARMLQLATEAPLDVFCIATSLGCKNEAEAAARHLAFSNLRDMYSPRLEFLPVDEYYRLLEYHHGCQVAIRAVWQDSFPAPPSKPKPAPKLPNANISFNLFGLSSAVSEPDPALSQFEWLEAPGVATAKDCIWQAVLEQKVDSVSATNRPLSIGPLQVSRTAIADMREKVETAVSAALDAVTFRREDDSSQDKKS